MTAEQIYHKDVSFLEPAHAKKIFAFTFFLSQGSPYHQNEIFEDIHAKHPGYRVTDSVSNQITINAKKKAETLSRLKLHKTLDQSSLEGNARRAADSMQEIFSKPKASRIALEGFAAFMINRDLFYIESLREEHDFVAGRPDRRHSQEEGSDFQKLLQDKFLSHFCYFILGKKQLPVDVPELEEFLDDIRKFVSRFETPEKLEEALKLHEGAVDKLMSIYNTHHPQEPVSFPFKNNLTNQVQIKQDFS